MEQNTYLGLCSLYYELDKPYANEEALQFYKLYCKNADGPILEPMCGTGRYLLPLLQEGFGIEGYDSSTQMLSILNDKAKELNVTPNVWKQFAEDKPQAKQYNLVLIPEGSFGLIIDQDKANNFLKTIYNQLIEGGKLVFEVETPQYDLSKLNVWNGDLRDKDENSFILLTTSHLKPKDNVETIVCIYDLVENNKVVNTEIEKMQIRHYDLQHLTNLLKEVGFKEIKAFKPYKMDVKPDIEDKAIVLECIK